MSDSPTPPPSSPQSSRQPLLAGASVLVAGATGGLGSRLTAALAARGARLTLTARDGDRLADVSTDGAAEVVRHLADLRDPGAAAGAVAAAVDAHGGLDGLVCAIGVVAFGPAGELGPDIVEELFLTNVFAPMFLTRAALAHLGTGNGERPAFVVNLSAVVAEQPTAGMAAYSATKGALSAFDAALAKELRRSGVRVIDARPPHTETGLAGRPIAGAAPRLPAGLDPDAVAERIVAAIEAGETDLPAAAFS